MGQVAMPVSVCVLPSTSSEVPLAPKSLPQSRPASSSFPVLFGTVRKDTGNSFRAKGGMGRYLSFPRCLYGLVILRPSTMGV